MKKKEPIDIEFTEQKAGFENYKNAIDFKWSSVQEEEEDIALTNFIKNYQKSNWMITWWLQYRT